MADEIETLVIGVRADTRGFAGDVAAIRGELTGPLAEGAGRAGLAIERSLGRALASGRLGFDQLKKVALSALADIASASLRALLTPGGGGSGTGGLLSGLANAVAGAPGRATGGPVSAGRAYLVGERGPELFVPGHGGRIERMAGGSGAGRDVRVGITVTSPRPEDPQLLRQSSRQVARAVRSALRSGR